MQRKRILFTLTDLHAGGAQRVILTLLRHLSREDFELEVALVRKEGRFLSDVPDDVPVHDLQARRVIHAGPAIIALAKKSRPDIIFSTLSYMNIYLLLLRPFLPRGTRVIVREAIAVSSAYKTWKMSWIWPLLFRVLYRRADQIICQCEFMAKDLEKQFGVPHDRISIIYNPVDADGIRDRAEQGPNPFSEHGSGPHLVAAGRIAPQKGFDLLIQALPRLLEISPEARLWILGEDTSPDDRTIHELQALSQSLSVEEHVHFAGLQDNPFRFFRNADLFVLSSRYEGLPNVLLEAIATGCPVVALDRPGGTREIMELTGQPNRLRQELDWDLNWMRGQLDTDGCPPDLSQFSLTKAVESYQQALRNV